MNNTFILFLLAFLLAVTSVLAQKDLGKIYTARVNSGKTGPVTKRDKDEITFQAKNKIDNLEKLLNVLKTPDLSESDLNSIIKNSYLPNQDQIFYNDAIVIEDDINPKHINSDSTAYLKVDRYLRDLDLFYAKSDSSTIIFSRKITSPVLDGSEYPYIKVFFTSTFAGKHSQFNAPYQPVQRVAELRAEKVEGKWRTFVTRLGFLRPGEGLAELSAPVIAQDFASKPRIKGDNFLYKSKENDQDTITIRWDQNWLNVVQSSTKALPVGFFQRSSASSTNSQERVSIRLMNKDQLLTFRRVDGTSMTFQQIPSIEYLTKIKRRYKVRGWLQIIVGTAALGISYAGYSSLQQSYNDYSSRINALNAEYAVWQTLSQQPSGSPAVPMSFNSYSQPGIYAVYGGGVAGSGLIITGIRQLLKAGNIKIKR